MITHGAEDQMRRGEVSLKPRTDEGIKRAERVKPRGGRMLRLVLDVALPVGEYRIVVNKRLCHRLNQN